MNNDRLKDYIKNHRDEFDQIENPNLDLVWQAVKKSTPAKNNNWKWNILLIIGIGILGILCFNYYQTSQKLTRLENYVLNFPEYKNEHQRLVKNVNDREKLLEQSQIDQSDFEELFLELQQIDKEQILLEKDFLQYGESPEVMKTLFKQYERKTKILEILLFEIEKKKHHESYQSHNM